MLAPPPLVLSYAYDVHDDRQFLRLRLLQDHEGVYMCCEGNERFVEAIVDRVYTKKFLDLRLHRPEWVHEESATIDRFSGSGYDAETQSNYTKFFANAWYSSKETSDIALGEVTIKHSTNAYIVIHIEGECKRTVDELSRRIQVPRPTDFPFKMVRCQKHDEEFGPQVRTGGHITKEKSLWWSAAWYTTEGIRQVYGRGKDKLKRW